MVVQCDKWKNSSSTIAHSGIYNPFSQDILDLQLSKNIFGNYSEAISSVMAKVEMAKYIHLKM